MQTLVFLLFSTPLFTATDAAKDERPGLAVLDLQIKQGVESAAGEMLNDLVLDQLGRSGHFSSVIGGSDIREMLSMEQQKQALGCDEESCLAELGGALGVPLMFTSNVGAFGGKFIINLKLISVDDAKVLARASRVVADESLILEALPLMLKQILKEGMGGTDKAVPPASPAPKAAAPKIAAEKSNTTRRPLTRRPMFYVGSLTMITSLAVGIGLNSPERGDFKETHRSFRKGEADPVEYRPLTATEFGDLVARRSLYNAIGISLGVVGAAVLTHTLGWGR